MVSQPVVRLRPVRCIAFFDESGQFASRGDLDLVATLVVTDHVSQLDQLRRIAAVLAPATERVSNRRKLVLDLVTDEMLDDVRQTVRASEWLIHHAGVRWDRQAVNGCRDAVASYAAMVREFAHKIGNGIPDLRPLVAASGLEGLSDGNVAYTNTWFHVLETTLKWLRSRGILPLVRAVVDRRPGLSDAVPLELLGRLSVFTVFGDVYRGRLTEALGCQPTFSFNATMSGDERSDGLVVVDLIAKAYGRALGLRDPTGRWERFRASLDPVGSPAPPDRQS